MIVAVPASQDHQLFSHFGKAPGFLVYAIDQGRISKVEWRPVSEGAESVSCGPNGHIGCGTGLRFASLDGCDVLGVISLGAGARSALASRGLRVVAVPPGLDPAKAALLAAEASSALGAPEACGCSCGEIPGLT